MNTKVFKMSLKINCLTNNLCKDCYEIKTFKPCYRTVDIHGLGKLHLPFPYITFIFKCKKQRDDNLFYYANTMLFSNKDPSVAGHETNVYLPPLPNIYSGHNGISDPCLSYYHMSMPLISSVDDCVNYFWNSGFTFPHDWGFAFNEKMPDSFFTKYKSKFGMLDNFGWVRLYIDAFRNWSLISLDEITSVVWKKIPNFGKLGDIISAYDWK